MQSYFTVLSFEIPMELKSYYQQISDEFEKKVFDAIARGEENEIIEKEN